MPFRIAGRHSGAREHALELLGRLGLSERVTHTPGMLSGGEQQRRVWDILADLQRELGFALLLATHNERLAAGCDRVLRLADGRLEELAGDAAAAYFRHPSGGLDSQETPSSGQ